MQNCRHEVGVASGRHTFQEVPANRLTAIGQMLRRQEFRRASDDVWLIEHNAAQPVEPFQKMRHEPPMATAYTSVESEIEDRRRRLLHHSAHNMPSTAHASENHTMLLPLLNGSEISLTKKPLYRT